MAINTIKEILENRSKKLLILEYLISPSKIILFEHTVVDRA